MNLCKLNKAIELIQFIKKFLKFSYVIAEKDAPMVEEYNVFVNLGVGLLGLQTDK